MDFSNVVVHLLPQKVVQQWYSVPYIWLLVLEIRLVTIFISYADPQMYITASYHLIFGYHWGGEQRDMDIGDYVLDQMGHMTS